MNQKRLLLKVYTKGYAKATKAKKLSSIDDYLTSSLNSFQKETITYMMSLDIEAFQDLSLRYI